MKEKKEVKRDSLEIVLKENERRIKEVAPKYVNVGKLIRLAIEAKKRNPLLARCSPYSIVDFCIKMAEAGTDRIGSGGMWAVPFKNKKGWIDMVAIPDWRLIVEKCKRAGAIKHAYAEVVYDCDKFEYEKGLNPKLVHIPNWKIPKEKKKIVAVYCVYILPDDSKDFVIMTKEEIDRIKEMSKAKDQGPWVDFYEEMAKKTVIKRALKQFEGADPMISKVLDIDNQAMGLEKALNQPPIEEPKAIEEKEEEEEEKIQEGEIIEEEEKEKEVNPWAIKKCEKCGKEIIEEEAEYSQTLLGEILCKDCLAKKKK